MLRKSLRCVGKRRRVVPAGTRIPIVRREQPTNAPQF